MNTRRQDRFWNQLLGIIAKGRIVPVVGEDILALSDGSGNLLYGELARRYASYCDLEYPPEKPPTLSATVRSHPEFRDNPHDIYQEIGEEYNDWNPGIPEPLIQLAGIRHFNLFVSTTFDNLLERAINQVRFNGQNRTIVIAYSPKHIPSNQIMADALSSGRPVVFQLFGSYKNPLQFALTEGDMVEYMHALQSTEYCPKRMFDELYERPLLMLGNNFPDWLARLFLRMTRKTSLDHRDVPKQYFVDTEATGNPLLKFFLRRFTTNTELVEKLDPIRFTQVLAEKWQAKYGAENDSASALDELDFASKPMPRNSVFISYCATSVDGNVSADSRIAMVIRDVLEASGIKVWLDKHQLQGGDEYERKIERYIKTCSLFMPLVSETTDSRNAGFFRKEWSWALKRLPDFTGADRQFLFPVAIGDIDPYRAAVPEEFKRYQFARLSDQGPDARFIENVRLLYESALAETGRTVTR